MPFSFIRDSILISLESLFRASLLDLDFAIDISGGIAPVIAILFSSLLAAKLLSARAASFFAPTIPRVSRLTSGGIFCNCHFILTIKRQMINTESYQRLIFLHEQYQK